jgi:hypothetical protein
VIKPRALGEIIERRRREKESGGDRFVPLRLDLEDEETGELGISVGGSWDRRAEAFAGTADSRVLIRYHPGQREAVAWFRGWLAAHKEKRANPPPPPTHAELAAIFSGDVTVDTDAMHAYSALFAGGRRGGKTWLAVRLAIAYAVEIPGSIVWLVAPEEDGYSELDRYARATISDAWVQHETAGGGWFLCNGSEIHMKSAYDADGLKEGRVDFVVLNEGQRCKKRAFEVLQLAIADVGGIVLVCANPPTDAKDQPWVSDFAAEAQAGRLAAVYVQFNPLLNPHIDRRALIAFAAGNDIRAVEVEILGMFLAPKDAVAYNWQRLQNEKAPPADGDVTEAFLRAVEEGDGIERVVGIDVQIFPYMAASEYHFFGTPTRDEVLAWITGEIALEGGDEVALSDAMYARGWNPKTTLLVVDGTGEYQHSRRRAIDSPPASWSGRGSFDIFRSEGWRRIVTPDRRFRRKNPPIQDRMRALTSMICSSGFGTGGVGVRRLYADPTAAPLCCKTMREWKVVNGKPQRVANLAHMGDGISYPIARLFPRRLRSGNPRRVDPAAVAVEKAEPIVRTIAPSAVPRREKPKPASPASARRSGGRWSGY